MNFHGLRSNSQRRAQIILAVMFISLMFFVLVGVYIVMSFEVASR